MKNIILKNIELPEFGTSEEIPAIPAEEYEKRFTDSIAAMNRSKMDVLLVFADREHFANFRFLTGLDPRFEEALLLIDKGGKRKILFGNENMGAAGKPPVPIEYELYQEFSLLGQDRSKSRTLEQIFKEFGIEKNKRVGCAYFKYYSDSNNNIIPHKLDIPAYMADILRDITGSRELVVNANDIFMESGAGLRNYTCLEELVQFEWANVRTSESIKQLVKNIKPGKREYELAMSYDGGGLPYSCHPMISSGEKAKTGMSSPSANKVKQDDVFTSAFGVWGALTCRAGMVADSPAQLDKPVANFFEKFWKNYFETVVTWYENIGIGISAGLVTEKVEAARDKSLFNFAVNTGHTIHLDEWVNSPFYIGSGITLKSGLALQMDIIPVSKGEFVAANMEDGIIIADETLRKKWAAQFPESWKRIEQRRNFMIDQLGIIIKPEVLPLSNIPAYYAPYLLSGNRVAVVSK